MSGKRWLRLILLVWAGLALLVACKSQTIQVTQVVTQEVEATRVVKQEVLVTQVVTETRLQTVVQAVEVTATPEPTSIPERSLTVCMGQEPDTLYLYGGSMLAQTYVLNAIYDGPIDNRSFDYQPVILEKLPSLADGDAAVQKVAVRTGDRICSGDCWWPESLLQLGDKVWPAGCRSDECAVTFDGTPIEMDQMVVTFTLKSGILWSDGQPVTAHDSVYSYELYVDPDSPGLTPHGHPNASYTAIDDRTVVWKGIPGYLDSTYFTNFWTPLPKHQLGDMNGAEIYYSEEANNHPLGWGPFMIAEWIEGEHITLVRNPYYFRADEGLPKLDKVVYRFVGADAETAIAAALTGECDVLLQDIDLDDQVGLLLELQAAGLLRPVFSTGTVWEHLDFGINPVESYNRPDFFEDARTRQAIAMCLDTQAVIDALLYGQSVQPAVYIPPEHPLYNPDVATWSYDPEAAQALLQEVGWTDADGDGVREAHSVAGIPEGTPLAFTWQSSTADLRVAYMGMYQEDLRQCGIDVALENLPAMEYFEDGPYGPLFGRRFDLGSFAWLTSYEPPCRLYLCDQIPSQENGWAGQNLTGFCQPEYDAACQAALDALPGEPDYEYYHKEAQRIFAEQLPVVPLFLRIKVAAARPEVCGFGLDPTSSSELWNLEEIAVGPDCP